MPDGQNGFPLFTNQESTNETYRLKDSQDRYSEPSYYTGTDSNTFRIPDNRNTLAVRNAPDSLQFSGALSRRSSSSFESWHERSADRTA